MKTYDLFAILVAIILIVVYALGVRKNVHFAWLGVAIYLTVPLIAAIRAFAG